MKISAFFAPLVFSQEIDQDRKFTDKPEWLTGEAWKTYANHPPGYRIDQFKCRIYHYLEAYLPDTTAAMKLFELFEDTARSIKDALELCSDVTEYEPPSENHCQWKGWLKGRVRQNFDL